MILLPFALLAAQARISPDHFACQRVERERCNGVFVSHRVALTVPAVELGAPARFGCGVFVAAETYAQPCEDAAAAVVASADDGLASVAFDGRELTFTGTGLRLKLTGYDSSCGMPPVFYARNLLTLCK